MTQETPQVELIRAESLSYVGRGGASNGVAEIAWAVADDGKAPLPAGFGRWHNADGEPKTLAYDEVLLVMEGVFGIKLNDGRSIEGRAGDLIVIPRGTTVTYFGSNAKLFFVVTPQQPSGR